MDIAFIKSYDVEWESEPTALAGAATASDDDKSKESGDDDDDDGEIPFTEWDFVGLENIPFNDIKNIPTGQEKIPPHFYVAATIIKELASRTEEQQRILDSMSDFVAQLPEGGKGVDFDVLLTRPFTEVERKYFESLLDSHSGSSATPPDTSTSAPHPPKPPAAPQPPKPAAAAVAAATEGNEDLGPASGRGRGRGGGRVKEKARRYRPESPPPVARAKRPLPQAATVQTTARVIVKKRPRSSAADSDYQDAGVVVEAHALPVSELTNRVMLGQTHLNKRFPKHYLARNPVKSSPIKNMTISSAFHLVPTLIITYCYLLLFVLSIVTYCCLLLPVITFY